MKNQNTKIVKIIQFEYFVESAIYLYSLAADSIVSKYIKQQFHHKNTKLTSFLFHKNFFNVVRLKNN